MFSVFCLERANSLVYVVDCYTVYLVFELLSLFGSTIPSVLLLLRRGRDPGSNLFHLFPELGDVLADTLLLVTNMVHPHPPAVACGQAMQDVLFLLQLNVPLVQVIDLSKNLPFLLT